MSFLSGKKSEFVKMANYILQVATMHHMERLSEVKKAVTMVINAYEYVVDTEEKMLRKSR